MTIRLHCACVGDVRLLSIWSCILVLLEFFELRGAHGPSKKLTFAELSVPEYQPPFLTTISGEMSFALHHRRLLQRSRQIPLPFTNLTISKRQGVRCLATVSDDFRFALPPPKTTAAMFFRPRQQSADESVTALPVNTMSSSLAEDMLVPRHALLLQEVCLIHQRSFSDFLPDFVFFSSRRKNSPCHPYN